MSHHEHVPPSGSRLRGTLISRRKVGNMALGEPESPVRLSAELHIPGLQGTVESVSTVLGGSATLVKGANVGGLWHYSFGDISSFSRDKAEHSVGKFGTGTYLGVGELEGETVSGLIKNGAIRHDVTLHEVTMLVIDRANVKDISRDLRRQQGLPEPRFTYSADNSPLADLAENIELDGSQVDCVMVYMDPARLSAEVVMLPRAVDHALLTGRL